MKKYFLLLLFFSGVFMAQAQNWKTVGLHDTTYFRGGVYDYDSFSLHVIWIDSAQQIGTDSLFTFYKTVRDTLSATCLDTAAGSWLGPSMIRKANGDEYYFNFFKDTIVLKTAVPYGASWNIAHDTGSLTIQATVTVVGTTTVDGAADSFKTISLQAYRNGIPITSDYNSLKLQLSKEHGWLQALDFFAFPNRACYLGYRAIGAIPEPAQLYRLPAAFGQTDINTIDLAWKYAPGNESISLINKFGRPIFDPQSWTYQYDSIISMQVLSGSSISYTAKRDVFFDSVSEGFFNSPETTIRSSSYIYTDIVSNVSPPGIIKRHTWPEVKYYSMATIVTPLENLYYVDTLCDHYVYKTRFVSGNGLQKDVNNPGCWAFYNGVSGGELKYADSLSGFGRIRYRYEYSSGSYGTPDFYDYESYTYLKLGSCTIGAKINVRALGVAHQVVATSFRLYPNPITGSFTAEVAEPGMLYLYNMQQQVIAQYKVSAGKATLHMPEVATGIYTGRFVGAKSGEVNVVRLLYQR